MKRAAISATCLLCFGFAAGVLVAHLPLAIAAPGNAASSISKTPFLVSIWQVRKNLVPRVEFTSRYSKTVTLSDGTQRHVVLTPTVHDGMPVVELNEGGQITYMGLNSTAVRGNLMVQVGDFATIKKQMRQLESDRAVR